MIPRPITQKNIDHIFRDISATEEVSFFQNRPTSDQAGFYLHRLATRPALASIVTNILNTYLQRAATIVEFGSGAQGSLYNLLVPEALKENYHQYDINPHFVEFNQQFTFELHMPKQPQKQKDLDTQKPFIAVGNIYEMPLADQSQDAVVGLSSWDSIIDFEQSFREVQRVLKLGGFFIHFQDIRPADAPLIKVEVEKRKQKSASPVQAIYFIENSEQSVFRVENHVLYALESCDDSFELLPLSRYLTNHLARVAQGQGLRVNINERITYAITSSCRDYYNGYKVINVDHPQGNIFISEPGLALSIKKDPQYEASVLPLQRKRIFTQATIDVIVAQKGL